MIGPYRDDGVRKHEALLADERALLVRVGKAMVLAGAIGMIAAAFGVVPAIGQGVLAWCGGVVVPGALSLITVHAGLVLSRLPGGSRDYTEITRAVDALRTVYSVKGAIVLTLVGLFALTLLVPMILYIAR